MTRPDCMVCLDNVSMIFGTQNPVTALSGMSLRIAEGEFVALVGPSGCGKTTTLKLVAGILAASKGHVFVGCQDSDDEARIGVVFQNPSLLPWLNVRDNIMLPLKIVPPFRLHFTTKRKTEYRDRAEALMKQVGLVDVGDKYPWQLSGGMQQRTSLCRALIHDPVLLLLDEPFSSLDQFTREEIWDVMQRIWIDNRLTVLLVTHDLKEAAYLATRICVIRTRPGCVVKEEIIPFTRPLTIDVSFQSDFTLLTQRLRESIVGAHSNMSGTP